jgi:phosphotransacetylase
MRRGNIQIASLQKNAIIKASEQVGNMNGIGEHILCNELTKPLLDNLKRHPKRIVFPEGEDVRLLKVAEQLVSEQAILPILIGRKDVIRKLAEDEHISLKYVRIISPEKSSDFDLFCERYERAEKMNGMAVPNVRELMKEPLRFACMMALYGQADGIVAGNSMVGGASVFRAVSRYRRSQEADQPLFGVSVMVIDDFKKFGGEGIVFMADTGITPVPTVENMAYYAVQTGKMARHLLGRPVQVSMVSASTLGSIPSVPSNRARAAVELANSVLARELLTHDISVEGEMQVDAALSPEAYQVRVRHSVLRRPSDVLIFPTLDAADLSKRFVGLLPSVKEYGMILKDILFPIAEVPRLATEESIFGTSLIVANQAIRFHQLYPDGVAPLY